MIVNLLIFSAYYCGINCASDFENIIFYLRFLFFIYSLITMNKKTLQALINLGRTSTHKLDHTNILQTVNHIPKGNQLSLKEKAAQYATT